MSAVDTRRKMVAWNFAARGRDGVPRLVSFHAATKAEATALARTRAAKAGYTIEGESVNDGSRRQAAAPDGERHLHEKRI